MYFPLRLLAVSSLLLTMPIFASEKMKPFVLASESSGDLATITQQVRSQLQAQGFEIAGSYTPYAGATILAVTNAKLKESASKTAFGIYGVAQRVALTDRGGKIEVSYTHPGYMAAAYRMPDDLQPVTQQLGAALGEGTPFGCSKNCMNRNELMKYRYMWGMPRFDDQDLLAEYKDQSTAVAQVEAKLAEATSGVSKVWRIDLPNQQATLFGVALDGSKGAGKDQDDTYIMQEIDFRDPRSTAHLPYEIVVVKGKIYALSAKFRIAMNFPDLSMMGANSFMSIMGAPDAIKSALVAAAGGKRQSAAE
jgi:hypothetical protein